MVCNFSKVAFYIFGLPIHWYSLAYIFGILLAMVLTEQLAKKIKSEITKEQIESFLNYAIIGIIVGGRLGHVLFYELEDYLANPIEILKIWQGGMSFYGGFLGVSAAFYIFCRKNKIDLWNFIDLWVVGIPIGLFFGRIANLINGELLGKPSEQISWYVIFIHDGIKRHPSQIYEAIMEGIFLFIVMIFSFYKGAYKIPKKLSGIFCLGYGFARFLCEFFREPDSVFSYQLYFDTGLNFNQYLSLAAFLLGLFLIRKKDAAN